MTERVARTDGTERIGEIVGVGLRKVLGRLWECDHGGGWMMVGINKCNGGSSYLT